MPRAPRLVVPQHWPVQDAARYKPLDWFVPYERNARTHPDTQVAILAGLLTKFGPDQDIVVDEDRIILKGHGRRLAAQQAGLNCFTFTQRLGLSEADKQAMRLADNQVALLSGWDKDLIQGEITSLKTHGYDILQLGFPEAQLRGWGISVGTESAVDPDAVPEPPKVPIVRPGDLWVLGDHRILCGDSTVAADVAQAAGNHRAQMVFTDPPFGVAYRDTGAGAWDEAKKAKKRAGLLKPRFEAIENDDLNEEDLLAFLTAYMRVQPLVKNASQYVCHANLRSHVFRAALLATGYIIRSACIWAKSRPGFNFAHYKWKHEPIFYAVPEKGKPVVWYGDQSQTTLWQVASESGAAYDHPTQKPVGLPMIAINNSSKAGDYIYEPFSGSGTTIIACEMTGRRCLAIEKDPVYVQVAIERWNRFTERQATLDGIPFDRVAAARRKGRAKGNLGKSVSGRNTSRGGAQSPVRTPRHARRPAPGRVPAGEPPVVAGDT